MEKIGILIFVSTLFFVCSSSATLQKVDTAPEAAVANKFEKVIDGKEIYNKFCVVCHGTKGNMGISGTYDLSVTKLTLKEKIEVITNGRNTMLPYKGLLSKKEIKAVAKYTEQLKE